MLASSNERVARADDTPRDDRLVLFKKARSMHQRCLEFIEPVQEQGKLSGPEAGLPASITDAIAVLDVEIEAIKRPTD